MIMIAPSCAWSTRHAVNWVGDTQGNQHEQQPAVTRLGIDPISDDCRADLGGKVFITAAKTPCMTSLIMLMRYPPRQRAG
jgi:hypothetical protein